MGLATLYIKVWKTKDVTPKRTDMNAREPAVAGMFYPAEAGQLERDISVLLRNAGTQSGPVPKAMILPHAGYVYSGPVAARGYGLLSAARQDIRRVVLFGPAHRVYLEGMAVPTNDGFATPLGTVPVDRTMIAEIGELPGVWVSDVAHKDEHSLEVQLPFLQTVLEDFELVPIVVGQCAPALVAAVMDAVWGGPETLIIVSSDLSHYLSYNEAQRVDANTCSRILNKATTLSGQEACGAHAINGLMQAAHCRPLRVEAVDVRNSGDTCGDKDRVVGYGAFILQ